MMFEADVDDLNVVLKIKKQRGFESDPIEKIKF
jgi:hypothetical protein